jgi:hypothetical protein
MGPPRGTLQPVAMKQLVFPTLVTGLGVAWLLNSLGILPSVDWIYSLGLALTGLVVFFWLGWNKLTVPLGGFLLASGVAAALRQAGAVEAAVVYPVLTIVLGGLLFASVSSRVPLPGWVEPVARDR